MSGFWIVMIAIGCIIIAAIFCGVVFAMTDGDIETALLVAMIWPICVVITPIVLIVIFAYRIVESIKEKQNGTIR